MNENITCKIKKITVYKISLAEESLFLKTISHLPLLLSPRNNFSISASHINFFFSPRKYSSCTFNSLHKSSLCLLIFLSCLKSCIWNYLATWKKICSLLFRSDYDSNVIYVCTMNASQGWKGMCWRCKWSVRCHYFLITEQMPGCSTQNK